MSRVNGKKWRRAWADMWAQDLDQLPRTDGRIPLLAIVKTPGTGNRRRALVVLDIDDWIGLHGPTEGSGA